MAMMPHGVVRYSQTVQKRVGLGMRLALIFAALALVAGFVWSALYDVRRTILLDLDTRAATLTFVAQANAWTLDRATVCRPRPEGLDLTRTAGSGPCDARRYAISDPSEVTIRWPAGSTAEVTKDARGVSIVVTGGPSDLPDKTRLVLDHSDWARQGALPFAAHLTAGSPMESGLTDFLLGGRWEARQSGWAIAPGRSDVSEVVKSGTLVRGSVLEVLEDCPDPASAEQGHDCTDHTNAIMYGHLSPAETDTGSHLELVALSHPGRTELSLTYFGAASPTIVRPSLIDIAITSPMLLALAVLLPILTPLIQVLSDLAFSFWRSGKPGADRKPDSVG